MLLFPSYCYTENSASQGVEINIDIWLVGSKSIYWYLSNSQSSVVLVGVCRVCDSGGIVSVSEVCHRYTAAHSAIVSDVGV